MNTVKIIALRELLGIFLHNLNCGFEFKDAIEVTVKIHNDESDLQYELAFNGTWIFNKHLKSEQAA